MAYVQCVLEPSPHSVPNEGSWVNCVLGVIPRALLFSCCRAELQELKHKPEVREGGGFQLEMMLTTAKVHCM